MKLAGRKVNTWWCRQHPKVLGLKFKEGVKRQERVNARVRYIEGDFTPEEKVRWDANFSAVPSPLTLAEKDEWMSKSSDVILSSDAFFPFRDGIDVASRYGVKHISQPGGSVQDPNIIETCDGYGMSMAFTGVRLFHH